MRTYRPSSCFIVCICVMLLDCSLLTNCDLIITTLLPSGVYARKRTDIQARWYSFSMLGTSSIHHPYCYRSCVMPRVLYLVTLVHPFNSQHDSYSLCICLFVSPLKIRHGATQEPLVCTYLNRGIMFGRGGAKTKRVTRYFWLWQVRTLSILGCRSYLIVESESSFNWAL